MRLSWAGIAVCVLVAGGCKPSDILSVPAPAGVLGSSALASQAGAESELADAKAQLFNALDAEFNLVEATGYLTDEMVFTGFSSFWSPNANVDARHTAVIPGYLEMGDLPWGAVLTARSVLLVALQDLATYEPASGRARVGEAYALVAYSELLLAEDYCGGTPLSVAVPGGGISYGMPLTTDSLLGTAVAHFDSAMAQANGDPSIAPLALVGKARALVDRGQLAAADTTVASVPTSFVYNGTLQPDVSTAPYEGNMYVTTIAENFYAVFNMGDREGENGLNFISANDPRLQVDSTDYQTADGTTWYVPLKFVNDLADIPLATGVEARLIEAEAALQGGSAAQWAADLNALRGDSADTHVVFNGAQVPIDPDSTTGATATAQTDFQFREKAFWLYGTGTRLGDLRRLVRQYGRDQSTVYPTGVYVNGSNPDLPAPIPSYGADVVLTLPTPAGQSSEGSRVVNPNYKGCLTPTTSA